MTSHPGPEGEALAGSGTARQEEIGIGLLQGSLDKLGLVNEEAPALDVRLAAQDKVSKLGRQIQVPERDAPREARRDRKRTAVEGVTKRGGRLSRDRANVR